jgi:hypothetical protein
MATDCNKRARRLRNAVEPVAAGVYFAPEAHKAYEALGFGGSPVSADGVARPELKSYFTSRGACMGQVTGEVVAAAFGCFNRRWLCRQWRWDGGSPAGRPSSTLGNEARPRCCSASSVTSLGAWPGSPTCFGGLPTRHRGLAARCTQSDAIIEAGSYPQRIAGVYNVGGGPHFGSGLTIDTAAQLHANSA